MTEFALRRAGLGDAELLAAAMVRGFDGYRSFAPAGWVPPALAEEVERAREALRGGAWALVAERDGGLAGHVMVQAARDAVALGHLRALFVERGWWGSGLAGALHAAALEEAARRGYTAIRLFTPEGQARARRFYEREGWRFAGDSDVSLAGLPVVEYRRPLSANR
jgi:GNAT superfamily N-acetyltransferase